MVTSIVIGLVALGLFILQQNMSNPMLDMEVLKYPMYVIGLIMSMSCMLANMSIMIILPMFLQKGSGLPVFITGLILLPGSILNGIVQPYVGRLFDKHGPKWLVISGIVIATIMLGFFTTISPASPVPVMITLHIGFMVSIALIWSPAQTNGLNHCRGNYTRTARY